MSEIPFFRINDQLQQVQNLIDTTIKLLRENEYPIMDIDASELIAYFEDDAPSGDTIVLDMVLDSDWLIIHELVEINELKKMGKEIDSSILFSEPEIVFDAHLVATYWELTLAKKGNDVDWITKRLVNIKDWMQDPTISEEQKTNCKHLLEKFS